MNFKHTLIAGATVVASLLLLVTKAYAAGSTSCEIIYGGGQVCPPGIKISIDKMVQVAENATTKGGERTFVDNITINDPKYGPSQTVKFSIKIENNGSNKLDKVDVVDILPDFIDFDSASTQMSVDSNNKKRISYSISNLEAGKSDTQTITGKIVGFNSLPADKSVVCVTNQSQAASNNAVVLDTAQVCIEKQVITTKGGIPTVFEAPKGKTTPPTGPELLPLIGLIPAGFTGFFLRKKSSLR